MATGTLSMTILVRTRGLWRLRLVGFLLGRGVYWPGSFGWVVRGFHVDYRMGRGEWQEIESIRDTLFSAIADSVRTR